MAAEGAEAEMYHLYSLLFAAAGAAAAGVRCVVPGKETGVLEGILRGGVGVRG